MIDILTYVSLFAGGILVILLLLSLLGGLDLDIGGADVDTDSDGGAGGLGVIKGALTFISVTSWVVKMLLAVNKSPLVAIAIGVFSGIVALAILSFLVRVLMKNDENVNWSMEDSLFQKGRVYLKIPAENGSGIIQVNVNGASREIKAKSFDQIEFKTGEDIVVVEIEGEYAMVQKQNS